VVFWLVEKPQNCEIEQPGFGRAQGKGSCNNNKKGKSQSCQWESGFAGCPMPRFWDMEKHNLNLSTIN
jgi:hypothetical protein